MSDDGRLEGDDWPPVFERILDFRVDVDGRTAVTENGQGFSVQAYA